MGFIYAGVGQGLHIFLGTTPAIFKTFAVKLYRDKGVRTHILANALSVSTATVWSWVVKDRGGKKIGYNSYGNKLKSYRTKYDAKYIEFKFRNVLKKAKIKEQAEHIRQYFQLLLRWVRSGFQVDLNKVAKGEEPPDAVKKSRVVLYVLVSRPKNKRKI